MEPEEIEAYIKSHQINGSYAERLRAQRKSEKLQLFFVHNTLNKRLFVLSESVDYALWIAVSAGHIKKKDNGQVYRPGKAYWQSNPGFQGAIKRAIAAKNPGVVQKQDQFAVVNGKVFAPISESHK